MNTKPQMQAVETINGTGPAPAARPRRVRRGPYSAVYDRAEKLKPGQWFCVAESALWDERRRVLAHEAIRKGFANRDMLDLIDCYIDHAGNIIVVAMSTTTSNGQQP